MKKWKGKGAAFLLVFVLGIATGLIITGAVRETGVNSANRLVQLESGYRDGAGAAEADDAAGSADIAEITDTVEVPHTLIFTGTFGRQDSYPQWDAGATYLGGDKALYNGKIYRAKWWTLGETPGYADVWEEIDQMPAQPQEEQENRHNRADESLKVVGYYPDWKGYQPEKLQYDILTHVVYAFAIPTREGGLRPLANPDVAVRLIQDAHKNEVKVLLAVGGWSDNGAELEPVFVSATQGSEKTRRFADQIMAMCEEYGFDGVDIDWEHPRRDGSSKNQYEELILYLADKLHGKGKLLTSAVMGGVSADGIVSYDAAAHSDAVLSAVDWIHVMAYDGGDGERHSSFDFAESCASYWRTTRKAPKEKVVLGVPFYGRPGWAAYEDILKADPEAWKKDHTNVNGIDAYYNGVDTIEQKTRYAKEHLGGIMIWELTQDTADRSKSLLSAIGR